MHSGNLGSNPGGGEGGCSLPSLLFVRRMATEWAWILSKPLDLYSFFLEGEMLFFPFFFLKKIPFQGDQTCATSALHARGFVSDVHDLCLVHVLDDRSNPARSAERRGAALAGLRRN